MTVSRIGHKIHYHMETVPGLPWLGGEDQIQADQTLIPAYGDYTAIRHRIHGMHPV
jgi:hypothetical protein